MRKLSSIQIVNSVEPIETADSIEKIHILGWWVVVKKGESQPGEKFVYCEIDSLLPERGEFEFLRASSFMAAQTDPYGELILPARFRIKTVRPRGHVSQGSASHSQSWLPAHRYNQVPTSRIGSAFSSGNPICPSESAGK